MHDHANFLAPALEGQPCKLPAIHPPDDVVDLGEAVAAEQRGCRLAPTACVAHDRHWLLGIELFDARVQLAE